ncbi:MAG: tRNA guanosine(34) transglycosylase Tgt [Clostridia bacterium]|nr:tRNA guanosine(34) transglycosylase Tgt [Clostridia bacterium]
MLTKLKIKNHEIDLPIFCPDATRGVVRSLTSKELEEEKVDGVIVNTWHLHLRPGEEKIAQFGGIAKLMDYHGLIISDSGGFQVFSLFQKDPEYGRITDEGLVTYTGKTKQHKVLFTPENSIQMQFALGSDIMICLDDFTPPNADEKRIKQSVARTVAWAKRCKVEFEKQCLERGLTAATRPHLYGVIQGHLDKAARKDCAEQLLKIGFDGYGLGGWLFNEDGTLNLDICAYNASLTPDNLPRYALGVGKGVDVEKLYRMGYTIFDCVLPTRDARHGRLYNDDGYLYIDKKIYELDEKPLSANCDCQTCRRYSRAYLHHLFKIGDSAFYRHATCHNLRFYTRLCERLRPEKE